MARKRDTASSKERAPRKRMGPGTGAIRRRGCWFCKEGIEEIDYKNGAHLRRYVSEKGKIRSRRVTGACRKHQRHKSLCEYREPEKDARPYQSPPSAGADDVPASVWTDVRAQLVGVLEHATLQDFVARAEASGVKRAALPATMYFI